MPTRSYAFTQGRQMAEAWKLDPAKRTTLLEDLREKTRQDPVEGMMLLLAFQHFACKSPTNLVDDLQAFLAPEMK